MTSRSVRFAALCGLAAVVLAAGIGRAAEQASSKGSVEPSTAEAEVRAAADKLLAAKQQSDGPQLSKLWTQDGSYVDAAGQTFSVAEVIRGLRPTKASNKATPASRQSTLRFLTPEVAIEDGQQPYRVSPDGSVSAIRFTAVWVKREGQWLLDTLRESAVESPAPHDRLEPLAWLLGEWAGSTPDADLLLSVHWSSSGAYLLRDFVVRAASGDLTAGTQRIGWDPAAQQIKSWTFDSTGGVAEATWRQDGRRWIASGQETLPDGSVVDTTTTYAPSSDGRFRATIERSKSGAALPALKIDFQKARETTD